MIFRCLIREVPRRIKTLGGVVTIRIASVFQTRCFNSTLSLLEPTTMNGPIKVSRLSQCGAMSGS